MSICLAISDADLSLTKSIFEFISSIATIVGVIAAISFGWYGVRSWKSQIRAKNNHDIAYRVLVELFKFEKTFSMARSRGYNLYSSSSTSDESDFYGVDYDFANLKAAIDSRIEALEASYSDLLAVKLEADVNLGRSIGLFVEGLGGLLEEYLAYARLGLRSRDPFKDLDYTNACKDDLAQRRNVFEVKNGGEDSFGMDLERITRELEIETRRKMI